MKVLIVKTKNGKIDKRQMLLVEQLEKAGYEVYYEEWSSKIKGMEYDYVLVDELSENKLDLERFVR
jgi:hypothetical protein